MPAIAPVKRKKLIRFLRKARFDGPYQGGKHQFMIRGNVRLIIPNPHQSDIGIELLKRILKQVEITRLEWEQL